MQTTWLGNGSVVGESVTDATPVPLRLAVCGLPLALSVTVKVSVRVPVAEGVNSFSTRRSSDLASELPQLLVCAKSPLFAPVMAMLLIESAVLPEFERVAA